MGDNEQLKSHVEIFEEELSNDTVLMIMKSKKSKSREKPETPQLCDYLKIKFAEDQAPCVLGFTKTTTVNDIVIDLTNQHPYLSPELHNLALHIESMSGGKKVFENMWPYEDEIISELGLEGEVNKA